MNAENLERRSITALPDYYWNNYEYEDREVYLVPLYDAVGKSLEVRGADTPSRNALAVVQALGLEVQEYDGALWVSSDTADLVAGRIFWWEVTSYSALKDHGLESLFPLDFRAKPTEDNARLIKEIGDELDPETGFIGRLRCERFFDSEKAERYLSNLSKLDPSDPISRELAQLIWSLPVLLQWQREWEEPGSERYQQIDEALTRTVNALIELIGFP